MNAYFFGMTVVSARTCAPIGKRVGVVFADDADHARDIAWKRYGNDTACQLWVEEIPETGFDFTVYKSEI